MKRFTFGWGDFIHDFVENPEFCSVFDLFFDLCGDWSCRNRQCGDLHCYRKVVSGASGNDSGFYAFGRFFQCCGSPADY